MVRSTPLVWLALAVLLQTALSLGSGPAEAEPISTQGGPYSLVRNQTSSALAPVTPAVPLENNYEVRALPPQEAADEIAETPDRLLQTEFLDRRGIKTYGWVDAGIGANNWGSPFNGPITMADRNWQGQMNQLYGGCDVIYQF